MGWYSYNNNLMTENTEENKSAVERAGEDLFNFAVDREDIKT